MTSNVTKLKKTRIDPPASGPFRLRVGNGEEEGVTKLVDLPPWPIDNSVVDLIHSVFHFHRLDTPSRYAFMNEAWRVLKPGGQLVLVAPHWSSMRAITDPKAVWPPLCESSFMVYSQRWREAEQMTDLGLICDFGDSYGYGYTLDPDISVRNEEFQLMARKHYVNAILDLHLTLTKTPGQGIAA